MWSAAADRTLEDHRGGCSGARRRSWWRGGGRMDERSETILFEMSVGWIHKDEAHGYLPPPLGLLLSRYSTWKNSFQIDGMPGSDSLLRITLLSHWYRTPHLSWCSPLPVFVTVSLLGAQRFLCYRIDEIL